MGRARQLPAPRHDPAFWRALGVTLTYTGLVVTATVVTSVLTALLMNADFHGRAAAAAITLPYAVPEVAAVLVWTMLSQQFGVFNVFARWLFRRPENLPWLTNATDGDAERPPPHPLEDLPLLQPGRADRFQTLQAELYEAARIDGAACSPASGTSRSRASRRPSGS